jgi:ATP synthase F1 epsilon subunit
VGLFSTVFKNMSLQVRILTPDQQFWDAPVDEIILPTNSGQMGVLTNHAPLMTALEVGVMLVRIQKEWKSIALMAGFAFIKNNQVTILVNEAESAETIDADQAKEAYDQAQTKWDQADGAKQKVEANMALKRARARYQVVKASV